MHRMMLLVGVLSIMPLQSRPVVDAQAQQPRSTESVKDEVVVATRIYSSKSTHPNITIQNYNISNISVAKLMQRLYYFARVK